MEEPLPVPQHAIPILGMNPTDELFPAERRHGVTCQLFHRGVGINEFAVHVICQHHFVQISRKQPEILLSLPERLFRQVAFMEE